MVKMIHPLVAALAFAGAVFVAAATEIQMPVLFVAEQAGVQSSGGFCRLTLTCDRKDRGTPLRIAISDDTPAGGGESLRGCLWVASVAAGFARNDILDGVRLNLEMKGQIDGPSIGAISCLSIVSWLDGRTLPADFAMTGTILPDGTIGPVGGIAYKLEAAASNGVKRVCIPAFERFEKLDDEKTVVDLFGLGAKLGIEVRPVRSLDEAYAVAHGLPLPSREETDTAIPLLPHVQEEVLVRLYVELGSRLKNLKEEILGPLHEDGIDELNVLRAFWQEFASGKIDGPKKGSNDSRPLDVLKEMAGSESLRKWLMDDTCEREFYAGRLLAAVRNLMTRVALWRALGEWTVERRAFFKSRPLLARNPPYTKNVQRLIRADVEALVDAYRDEERNPPRTPVPETGIEPVSKDVPVSAAQFETFRSPTELLLSLGSVKLGKVSNRALAQADDEMLKGIVLYDGFRRFFKIYARIWSEEERLVRCRLMAKTTACALSEKLSDAERFFSAAVASVVAELDAYAHEDAAIGPAKGKSETDAGLEVEDSVTVVALPDLTFQQAFSGLLDQRMLLEQPERLANRPYHEAALLSISAELLARACAQFVLYDATVGAEDEACHGDNALFLRHLISRARMRAIRELNVCAKAGLPVIAARLAFETAELSDRDVTRDLIREVLANYWAAEFSARAFRLGFKGCR